MDCDTIPKHIMLDEDNKKSRSRSKKSKSRKSRKRVVSAGDSDADEVNSEILLQSLLDSDDEGELAVVHGPENPIFVGDFADGEINEEINNNGDDEGSDFCDDDSMNVVQHGAAVFNERGELETGVNVEPAIESVPNPFADDSDDDDVYTMSEDETSVIKSQTPRSPIVAKSSNPLEDSSAEGSRVLTNPLVDESLLSEEDNKPTNPYDDEDEDQSESGPNPFDDAAAEKEEEAAKTNPFDNESLLSEKDKKPTNPFDDKDEERSASGPNTFDDAADAEKALEKSDKKAGPNPFDDDKDEEPVVTNKEEERSGESLSRGGISPGVSSTGSSRKLRKPSDADMSLATTAESYEVSSAADDGNEVEVVHFISGRGSYQDNSITSNSSHSATTVEEESEEEDVVESSKRLLQMAGQRMEYQHVNDEIKKLKEQVQLMEEQAAALTEQLRRAITTKCDLVLSQTEMERCHEQDLIAKDDEINDMTKYNRDLLETMAISELNFMNEISSLSDRMNVMESKHCDVVTGKDEKISELEQQVGRMKTESVRSPSSREAYKSRFLNPMFLREKRSEDIADSADSADLREKVLEDPADSEFEDITLRQ
jgi:hypothetical protein